MRKKNCWFYLLLLPRRFIICPINDTTRANVTDNYRIINLPFVIPRVFILQPVEIRCGTYQHHREPGVVAEGSLTRQKKKCWFENLTGSVIELSMGWR